MIEENNAEPFDDPALIEASHGDQKLLNRLVGLDRAKKRLEEDPCNETFKILYDAMHRVVEERQHELGLLPYQAPTET